MKRWIAAVPRPDRVEGAAEIDHEYGADAEHLRRPIGLPTKTT
jgi:hypothetical protein